MQKVSPRGLAEIAAHEGIVQSPWIDPAGTWTVGIGHTAAAGPPDPARERREFPLAEILAIFARDIAASERRVSAAFTRRLTQAQFDAAVSFDFHTGAIGSATWVRLFNAGEERAARTAMLHWRRPPEIQRRRRRECALFFDGIHGGDGSAMCYPADAAGKVLWHMGRRVDMLALLRAGETAAPRPYAGQLARLRARAAAWLARLRLAAGKAPHAPGEGGHGQSGIVSRTLCHYVKN